MHVLQLKKLSVTSRVFFNYSSRYYFILFVVLLLSCLLFFSFSSLCLCFIYSFLSLFSLSFVISFSLVSFCYFVLPLHPCGTLLPTLYLNQILLSSVYIFEAAYKSVWIDVFLLKLKWIWTQTFLNFSDDCGQVSLLLWDIILLQYWNCGELWWWMWELEVTLMITANKTVECHSSVFPSLLVEPIGHFFVQCRG